MDSVNFKEAQNAPLNWRNTGSNTNPISCACCGSKDYMQTMSQANFFRMMYPGMPRCRLSQDCCENSCTSQPFFSTHPALQPFFNSTMPSYFCCSHYHVDDTKMSSNQPAEKNQGNCKSDKNMSHKGDCGFDQKVRHEDNPLVDENARKHIGPFGMDPQFLPYQFFYPNPMDPRLNTFHQCACRDPTQWSCSPFIMPIVSYCLFWNSQKHKVLLSNHPEMMLPHHNEKPLKHPNMNEEKIEEFEIVHKTNSNNLEGNVTCISEESLKTDIKSEKEWKNNEENNFFVARESFTDLNKKENAFFDCNYNDKCAEKEITDLECFSVENTMENEEFFFHDTQSSLLSAKVVSMDSDDDHSKEFNTTIQSPSQPKMEEKYKNCAEEEIVPEPEEESSNHLNRTQNNITGSAVAYMIEDAVAAGDAGGEHCVGYKVLISSLEENMEGIAQENNSEETNLETNELQSVTGVAEQKRKNAEMSGEKKTESSVANSRHKTTVAKNGGKATEKEITDKKESKEESYAVKRKHACFPNAEGQIENSSKIQKMKNQTATKDSVSGKQEKTTNKSQCHKREEKVSTLRIRPRSIQTQRNTTAKPPKK